MAGKIKIESGDVSVEATLNDTVTAREVMEALPIEGSAQTWGDEVYFEVPVSAEPENAQETVEMGDLGYWPPGSALCIFFGPTPMSSGDEIRPASPVNVFGKIDGDPTVFKSVSNGDKVTVTEA
ncbi:MAG: cyclophilin-like fold protein [Armatimonadota bacterium]